MTASRVRSSAPRSRSARLAITLFALFAFTLQTYVTQTHIHGMARINSAAAPSAFDKNAAHKQQPSTDPANCPICQEILHTGYYVTPSVAVLPLPAVAVSIAPTVIDIMTIVAAHSHSWKSRAPPLA